MRKNIVVMGDIVEDADMVRDSQHGTILKVGFLNSTENEEVKLDSFRRTFDLIIRGDGSICPVVYSLNQLFKESG